MMEIAITHSTTACVLIEIGSVRILTDPVFDSGSKWYRLGPAAWAQRFIGPAIDPKTLAPLDAVLLSHAHHLDNLDEAGRSLLPTARTVITEAHDAMSLTGNVVGLLPWQETTIMGRQGERIRVTATPARHGPWWLPSSHRVIGFVLQWEGHMDGGLYISGDTVFFRGIRQVAERFKVQAAILHLGAVHFWPPLPPFLRVTFNGYEAAKTAKLLGAKVIVPAHYERSVWSHFRESVSSYKHEFDKVGLGSALNWLEPGKRRIIEI
jgi:L-ascorbate metabolism protein UlaG (beta-lactamase superfamily)